MKAFSFFDQFCEDKLILMNLGLAYPPRSSGPAIIRDLKKAKYTTTNAEMQGFIESFVESFWQRAIEINWTMFKDRVLELIKKQISCLQICSIAQP